MNPNLYKQVEYSSPMEAHNNALFACAAGLRNRSGDSVKSHITAPYGHASVPSIYRGAA